MAFWNVQTTLIQNMWNICMWWMVIWGIISSTPMTLPYTYIIIHVCKSHKKMGGLIYETSPYGFHHPSTIHAQRDIIYIKSQSKFVQANWSNSTSMQIVSTHFSSSSSSSVIRVWVVVCGGNKREGWIMLSVKQQSLSWPDYKSITR